jgi:hypothetical protein
VAREGAQIEVGGNEKYVSLCRRHWDDAMNGEWIAEASLTMGIAAVFFVRAKG